MSISADTAPSATAFPVICKINLASMQLVYFSRMILGIPCKAPTSRSDWRILGLPALFIFLVDRFGEELLLSPEFPVTQAQDS